jgi:anti-anti-sigma factor
MHLTDAVVLGLSVRTEGGCLVAALSGELEIAATPLLREQLVDLLRPSACRLVIDLSAVTYADVSGLAVLVGVAHRAEALGGFLRLAAPAAAVTEILQATGLDRQLDVFLTVQAAMTSPG